MLFSLPVARGTHTTFLHSITDSLVYPFFEEASEEQQPGNLRRDKCTTTFALRERVENTRILKTNCMGGQWSPKCGKEHMYQQCPRQPFGKKQTICWNPIPTYFDRVFSKCIFNACFITYRIKQHHGACNNKYMKGCVRGCILERGVQKPVLTGMCDQDPRDSYRRWTSRLRDQQDNNVCFILTHLPTEIFMNIHEHRLSHKVSW